MANLDKIEELQEILRDEPENYQARRELAVLLVESGFPKEAVGHLTYLSKKFPNDSNIFYHLGIAFEKLKEFINARDAYLKAIELLPDELDAVFNLGLVYTELKEFDLGIACFEKVLEKDANDSNSYFSMGICYLKKGDLVNAMMNFQNTIDLNDDDLYAHFYIGNILMDMGDLAGAKESFLKVIELSPDYSWAYYNLASIAFEEQDFENVAVNLEKTVELNPKDEGAYINYAKVLTKIGLYEDARQILFRATEECSAVGDLYYYAAQVARHEGNQEEYVENLNMALQNRETLTISVDKVMDELSYSS